MKNTPIHIAVLVAIGNFAPLALIADEYYAYDESGNIIEKRIGSEEARLKYNPSNQLEEIDSAAEKVSFDYDNAGAMIGEAGGDDEVSYQRGHLSRIRKVVRDGKEVEIFYDHRGFPAGKQSGTNIIPWSWEGSQISVVGAEVETPELGLRDYLGSDLAAEMSGTAFGRSDAGRFTGKFWDAEIGALIFPYRFYRADLARWMESDPSGFPDGANSYAYVGGDPLSRTDPLGLDWKITVDNASGTANPDQDNSGSTELEVNGSMTNTVLNPQTYEVVLWAETREHDLWPNPDDVVEAEVKLEVNCDIDDGIIYRARKSGLWKKIRSNPVIGVAMRTEAPHINTEKTRMRITNDHEGKWNPSGVSGATLVIAGFGGGLSWSGGEKLLGDTTTAVFNSYEDG